MGWEALPHPRRKPGLKKALAYVVTCACTWAGWKLGMPTELVLGVCGTGASWILGQGIADHGKEAAKVHTEAMRPPGEKIAP